MTGSELRRWRTAHSLTIDALAHLVGVSALTIWRWEQTPRLPRPAQAEALARTIRKVERAAKQATP